MAGVVRIDAKPRGVGDNPHEMAGSLAGPFSATLLEGKITNAAFTTLTAASLDALGIRVPVQGETALRCAKLIGSFTNGVALMRTIALETSHLSLQGSGQVDFRTERVAFKVAPTAQISGSPVSMPVVIEGPFYAMQGRLNADGVDKRGLFIDGLFGGDHPKICADAGLIPGAAGGKAG